MLERYKDCLTKLSQKPSHLKDFANLVETITKMKAEEKDKQRSIFKATSQVDQMYMLLLQYDVTPPSEDAVLHDEVQENQKKYRTEIELAQSYRDSKLEEMISMVGTNVTKMQDSISSIVSRFDEQVRS